MENIKKRFLIYYDSTLNFFSETLTQSSSKDGFIKYFKNTGWLFLGKMSSMLASFFVGAYVARYLGPAQYGLLTYAYSFTGIFGIFANFGIDSILNRELVSSPEKREELLGSSFAIKIIGSIFSIFIIFLVLFSIKTDIITGTLIFISSLSFITSAFGIIDIYFQSLVLAKKIVKIQIIALIITTILKILFIIMKLGPIYFAITYLIEGLTIAVGLVYIYSKSGSSILRWKLSINIVKKLIYSSWPLMLSSAAATIYMRIDQVMIKNMISNSASGLYAIAVKLSEVWYFIPGIICTSLFPAIINAKSKSDSTYKHRIKNLYILVILISLILSTFIYIFSIPVIKILFGEEFISAYMVLRIYVWSSIPIFLGVAMNNYLIIENLMKVNLFATILGALLNVILNVILIPKNGINGAAIATLISYSSVIIFTILFIKVKKIYGKKI